MHLVDATMFFAPRSGGVKRYLLAKHDWIRRNTDIRHTLLVPRPQRDELDGLVTVPSPPLPFGGGYRFPLRPGPWRRRLLQLRPDVIETADPYCVPWAALRAGATLGMPVIGFYHSDLVRLLGSRIGRWTEPLSRRYVQSLYGRFDLVLAPSRLMAAKLEALGIQRVALQPLGVDTAVFHPRQRDPSLRRELGLAGDTRLLVFAGRFAREKNLAALVAAFRRLGHGYHLLLIGGDRVARPEPNVTVYPYQPSRDLLARQLASADALVHAGDSETFGLVALEGMACGLPVLGVDAGAVAELVDSSVGLLVASAGPAALAEGVEALCGRDLAALGRQARQRADARYGWEQVLPALVGRYRRLAGGADPMRGPRVVA